MVLDIRRTFEGDWTLETVSSYEKVDANKIKFLVPLPPHAQRKLSYTVTTRYGTSVRR